MKHIRSFAALMSLALLLSACTDYATFVTATDIGITADTKTQEIGIGYIRTELFTGPGYPEHGEAPQAVGFIASNLRPFNPHIKQLYATGDAAALVTQAEQPKPFPPLDPIRLPRPDYYGERRPLVFATGANLGLKVGFAGATAPLPTSIKFGYNREEVSVVPLQREAPTEHRRDRYAPVLAAIDMDLETEDIPKTELRLVQFFATGAAARNLATRPDIRSQFARQSAEAVAQAALTSDYSFDDLSRKIRAFWLSPGNDTVNRTNALAIERCMRRNNIDDTIPGLIRGGSVATKLAVVNCLQI